LGGITWQACEANHLPPNSAKVKNTWNYAFIPSVPPWNAQRQLYLFTVEVCTEVHVGLPVRCLLFLSCTRIAEMDVILKDVAQTETLTESKVTLISLVPIQNVHKIQMRYFSHVIQDHENIYVLYC